MAATLTAAGFARAVSAITGVDTRLAAVVEAHGIPPFFTREPGFPTLVLLILEQQVSLASGQATYRRVAATAGEMTPEAVRALDGDALGEVGVTRRKQRYLHALADAVVDGELDLDEIATVDDAEARRRLTAVPGIGPWTADVYLLAALRRPDVWPVGDRALQVSAEEVLGLPGPPGPAELEELGEAWRPHRASAARLLWHAYLSRRGRT